MFTDRKLQTSLEDQKLESLRSELQCEMEKRKIIFEAAKFIKAQKTETYNLAREALCLKPRYISYLETQTLQREMKNDPFYSYFSVAKQQLEQAEQKLLALPPKKFEGPKFTLGQS